MGWEFVKLGDLVHRKIGYGIVQPGANVDVGVPVIKVNNIISGLSNIELLEKTTTDIDARYTRTRLVGGELVISLVGSVGKTAIVPKTFAGCNLVRATGLIDIKDEILAKWVKYYIDSPQGQAYINSNVNTTVQVTLNIKSLSDMPIPLPDHAIREKIVAILSSLDDKIELNRRINANLEQQAQALYKSWFVDFEPFGGKMPEDWKEGRLEDIGEVVGGGTPSKSNSDYYTSNGIAWITPKDLSLTHAKFTSKGEIDITELGYVNSSAKLMPSGSVLFSSRAPIGYISIAKNDICTNQGFKSIVPNNGQTAYIYCYLKENILNIEQQASGSTFKEVSGSLMKSQKIIIPNDITLTQFECIMQPIFTKQEKLEEENKNLTTLRDTLLPKLMSGEITV